MLSKFICVPLARSLSSPLVTPRVPHIWNSIARLALMSKSKNKRNKKAGKMHYSVSKYIMENHEFALVTYSDFSVTVNTLTNI